MIFGDPHFTTLDNTTYTFNGLGEYTIVAIDDEAFEMQARTTRTSGRGLGTAFSAAAAKERGTATVEARIDQKGNFEFKFVLGFESVWLTNKGPKSVCNFLLISLAARKLYSW